MFSKQEKLLSDFLKQIGNPKFIKDTALFKSYDHPIIITDKDNEICSNCPISEECTASMEIYIPSLGRFIFDNEYNGDIDLLISLLNQIAEILQDFRIMSSKSESYEFYRQLTKKVIDLNPHAVSVLNADGEMVYQNINAQNGHWSGSNKKSATTFPIFQGSKNLGQILFERSQPFSSQSESAANPNREMAFHHILGTDPAITNCIDIAKQVSATNSTILILGESGTGKEVFAKAIHKGSQRTDEAFVAVNCAAIPENLLESELFGYTGGAFTGAKASGKTGKIVTAHKGTMFLDEIGDLPLSLQAKLLRVLQDKKVEPVGSLQSISVDVRFICATNKNIESLIQERLFREDLYYRINVIPIHIPPLRTRTKDILTLLDHNIKKYCISNDKSFKILDTQLAQKLVDYEWKGNVRELENVVEYAVTMCKNDCITIDHLPIYLKNTLCNTQIIDSPSQRLPRKQLDIINTKVPLDEHSQLAELFEKYGYSTNGKRQIARELNISLATLYRRIKKMKDEARNENN